MKIKVLKTFHSPNFPEFQEGKEYEVAESLGEVFVERGLAEDRRPVREKSASPFSPPAEAFSKKRVKKSN